MNPQPARRPIRALSDEESADKVALLQRAALNLRAVSQPAQADAVEELLGAAQTFTHELAEALAMADGWKGLYEQAKAEPGGAPGDAYERMFALQLESNRILRQRIEGIRDVANDGYTCDNPVKALGRILDLAAEALR